MLKKLFLLLLMVMFRITPSIVTASRQITTGLSNSTDGGVLVVQKTGNMNDDDDDDDDTRRQTALSPQTKFMTKAERRELKQTNPEQWKKLMKKRKRLRKLRSEVNKLTAFISSDDFDALKEPNNKRGKSRKRDKKKWHRRLLIQLRRLNKNLDRLKQTIPRAEMGNRKMGTKKRKKNRRDRPGVRQKKNRRRQNGRIRDKKQQQQKRRRKKQQKRRRRKQRNMIERLQAFPPLQPHVLHQLEKDHKMNALSSAKNQSQQGVSGRECKTHKDCRPGLCCHGMMEGIGGSICFTYGLTVGRLCRDSCQCAHGLHCYIPNHRLSSIKGSEDAEGICKVGNGNDIMSGTYLNQADQKFTSPSL